MKRKHLADGVFFRWRCGHATDPADRVDRAGDRNDGPSQMECEVELVEFPAYEHKRQVFAIDLNGALEKLRDAAAVVDRAVVALAALRRDAA